MSHVWFRFYHETLHDKKIRTLTPAHRWVWVAVLVCASESPIRGLLLITDDEPAEAAYLADLANVSTSTVTKALEIFAGPGRNLIERNAEMDCWQVCKWDERQFESDTSTDRTRKWREARRLQKLSAKRSGNVPGDVPGDVPGTDTEVIGHRTEDLAIASVDNSSPLSDDEDFEHEPPNHTAALKKLAMRDMEERKRDRPDLPTIKYEIPFLMAAAERRRKACAHVLARLAPDLEVNAIIDEIDAADPHRKGRPRRWDCACEGSGMVATDRGFGLCPDCQPARRTA